MKTIEEIADFYLDKSYNTLRFRVTEAMQEYAQQEREAAIKLALEISSERAETYDANEGKCGGMLLPCLFIDKQSILSLEQEILNKLKE